MNQRKARRIRKLAEELYRSGYDTSPADGHMNHEDTRFKRINRRLKKISITGAPARDYIRIMPR